MFKNFLLQTRHGYWLVVTFWFPGLVNIAAGKFGFQLSPDSQQLLRQEALDGLVFVVEQVHGVLGANHVRRRDDGRTGTGDGSVDVGVDGAKVVVGVVAVSQR